MKPGTRMFTLPNLAPACEADKEVEIISFDEFCRGEPASKARYHWPLSEIQKAVFIRILEGPRKGKVAMSGGHDLLPRRKT